MGVNPDAAQELDVSFRPPPPGSCFTVEQLAQLAQMIVVKLPEAALESESAPCASNDINNIASIDGDGCILVPAAEIYREEQTWDSSTPTTNLTFDGFAAQGFDALTCMMSIHIFLGGSETGIEVQKDPSGTAFIWPSYVITQRSAGAVVIAIKNATQDVRVELELLKLPLPVPLL